MRKTWGALWPGVFVTAAVISAGCVTLVTESNNHITMPHYSVVAPVDSGWHVAKRRDITEPVTFTRTMGGVTYRVDILKNEILDEELSRKSSRELADYYTNLEKSIMADFGEGKGAYTVGDMTTGEETIAGKHFYTVKYHISRKGTVGAWALYMYFPEGAEKRFFIMVVCSTRMPEGWGQPAIDKRDFGWVLEKLEYLAPHGRPVLEQPHTSGRPENWTPDSEPTFFEDHLLEILEEENGQRNLP